jgi:A/G-specific adenine glycosylase
MLQQTTVAAVRSRYDAFLKRFPDLSTLARAREDSVLAAWSGLGYYARARNLRAAARLIARRHGGVFPRDPKDLARLPGFGEYTAAAVASLAFGVRAPAADANVTRVVSRIFAIPGRAGSRGHRKALLERIQTLLPRTRPGDLTAALMDLGQSICTPRSPDCPRCPAARVCSALRLGRPDAYPRTRRRPRIARIAMAAAFVERDGRALLLRRRDGFLKGLWEFPSALSGNESASAARRGLTRTLSALRLRREGRPIAHLRHTVVHRMLEIEVFRARPEGRSDDGPAPGARWFSAATLRGAAIPTLTRKIARSVGFLEA